MDEKDLEKIETDLIERQLNHAMILSSIEVGVLAFLRLMSFSFVILFFSAFLGVISVGGTIILDRYKLSIIKSGSSDRPPLLGHISKILSLCYGLFLLLFLIGFVMIFISYVTFSCRTKYN